MISALQCSTSAKDLRHLGPIPRYLRMDSHTHLSVYTLDPSIPTACNSLALTEMSDIGLHRLPTTALVNDTSVDGLFSLRPPTRPIIHVNRVAKVGCHDMGTWAQSREAHDTKSDAVATLSLGFDGAAPSNYFPVNVARNSSILMEHRSQRHRLSSTLGQEDNSFRSLGTPGSAVSAIQQNVAISQYMYEDLSEGRRRVGDILVRCGVIKASGMPHIESTTIDGTYHSHPVDASLTFNMTAGVHPGENKGVLIPALTEWTSKWLHKLVIQPYLHGGLCFQYRGKSCGTSTSLSSRVHRVLNNVHNPVQVAIHTLWFIIILTGDSAQGNAPFLSVPIFRYLHNNGAMAVEDFMFRIFVVCAMIGDKTINDASLSTSTWCRLTRVPQVILNATEKYVLSCLGWNVLMTPTQWQDTIVFLRSCIKVGSAFDPFACDEIFPSGTMARCLDELISLSYANGVTSQQTAPLVAEILSPQPIRHYTHWEVFNTAEWRSENDPVINQKPRTIGIAPGADQNLASVKVGTTAKDLLDSILGSGKQTIISPRGRWSFWRHPPLVYDLVQA